MTDRRRVRLVFVAVLACAHPISAASQEIPEGLARFQLFNECRPIYLTVEGLHSDAAAIDLTLERISTLAESRLRAARLFTDYLLRTYLYINVNVSGFAFSVSVEYHKWLFDQISDETWSARTWNDSTTGRHGGDGGYIMQTLSESLDLFVLEYLRVNEDACR